MTEAQDCHTPPVLLGNSPAIQQIRDQLQKASLTEVPVLITGENGTGKGLVAKLLHSMSERHAHQFHKISCAALSSRFFDEEFERYANLSDSSRRGDVRLESPAENGRTLLLDEIGELDPILQGLLLCKLQDSQLPGFHEAGEPSRDVRLICTSSHELEKRIDAGTFRTDLFYRINVLRIHMPPLRDCVQDIPALMAHFIRIYSKRFGKYPVPVSSPFVKSLQTYHWPGNTRELENMAKRYVVLGAEECHVLQMSQTPQANVTLPEDVDFTTPLRIQTKRAVQHLERQIILGVLKAHNWNRRKTARSLNISYRTLLYKIKEGHLPRSGNSSPQ